MNPVRCALKAYRILNAIFCGFYSERKRKKFNVLDSFICPFTRKNTLQELLQTNATVLVENLFNFTSPRLRVITISVNYILIICSDTKLKWPILIWKQYCLLFETSKELHPTKLFAVVRIISTFINWNSYICQLTKYFWCVTIQVIRHPHIGFVLLIIE